MGTGKISATAVRFIKMGRAGRFEKSALKDSSLYLGYHKVPDEACRTGDWDAVYQHFLDDGHKPHVARNHARQACPVNLVEQPMFANWYVPAHLPTVKPSTRPALTTFGSLPSL